ncbi:MAG: hypothetical protein K5985_05155 [Lachnospiraceae bacterium]|nr:hypothetical protein [Lachnospiraceae bacterium]
MKLIHCADSFKDSRDSIVSGNGCMGKQSGRIVTFLRLVKYALNTSVKALLIMGDLFCPEEMNTELQEVLMTCIEKNPELEFCFLSGEDEAEPLSELLHGELKNVKVLEKGNIVRMDENLVITGAEGAEALSETDVNLVAVREEGKPEIWAGKHIDYLAFCDGSYRELRLEKRGYMVSPGYIFSGGESKSGFVELELSDGVLKHRYVRFSPERGVPILEQETFRYDISLKGEFTRLVMDTDISEDDKQVILGMGERALTGSEP